MKTLVLATSSALYRPSTWICKHILYFYAIVVLLGLSITTAWVKNQLVKKTENSSKPIYNQTSCCFILGSSPAHCHCAVLNCNAIVLQQCSYCSVAQTITIPTAKSNEKYSCYYSRKLSCKSSGRRYHLSLKKVLSFIGWIDSAMCQAIIFFNSCFFLRSGGSSQISIQKEFCSTAIFVYKNEIDFDIKFSVRKSQRKGSILWRERRNEVRTWEDWFAFAITKRTWRMTSLKLEIPR